MAYTTRLNHLLPIQTTHMQMVIIMDHTIDQGTVHCASGARAEADTTQVMSLMQTCPLPQVHYPNEAVLVKSHDILREEFHL